MELYYECRLTTPATVLYLWPTMDRQTRMLTEAFLTTAKYSVVMLLIGPEDHGGGTGVCSPVY